MTRFCKRLLAALLGAALLGGAALGAPTPVPLAPLTTGESAGQTLPTERPLATQQPDATPQAEPAPARPQSVAPARSSAPRGTGTPAPSNSRRATHLCMASAHASEPLPV